MSGRDPAQSRKRRTSRACDYCHQRSIRCRPGSNGGGCQNCRAFDQPCTFDRPRKRRGAPPRSGAAASSSSSTRQSQHETSATFDLPPVPRREIARSRSIPPQVDLLAQAEHGTASRAGASTTSGGTWSAPHIAEHATIVDLIELYFEIVYPIFPLFHQPSFVRKISRAEYTSDHSLFAVTMAVCALVSARVRDGAVFNKAWDVDGLQKPLPNVYYKEAIHWVRRISDNYDLNTLRTHAILALVAIQEGKTRDMHEHLGHYHTILAMEGWHDEANWPIGLGFVEREERRRLFWSIYTLDVFTSIAWGGVIRSRECQSSVSYPIEADDDMFDDSGQPDCTPLQGAPGTSNERWPSSGYGISWVAGRNFVTDLYRMIERLLTSFATRPRAQREIRSDESLHFRPWFSHEAVQDSMLKMYSDLPQCFKDIPPITCKPRLDRFGFQAADIIATLQLLRMVVLSATGGSITDRCRIISEVVTAFMSIPSAYHHAISVPLLYHLGVIAQLLGNTLGQPLSENDYNSIRDVLLSMVRLLSTLEGLHASKGASERLSHHVARIDEYMASQRQQGGPDLTTMETPAASVLGDQANSLTFPGQDSSTLDETLAPFYLPSELLGDISNIFDFSGSSQG